MSSGRARSSSRGLRTTWSVPSAANYDRVRDTRFAAAGGTEQQVQAAWVKLADARPTVALPSADADAYVFLRYLGQVARAMKVRYPNLQLVFFSSRIYAGYASSELNPEPYAYESGFAVKGLIAAQIAGVDSLAFDSGAGVPQAPWLSWGPYLWADGLAARSDGLTWQCSDFVTDGTHPSASGRTKVADGLLAFFRADATTAPWYLAAPVGAPAPPTSNRASLGITPNPAASRVAIELVTASNEAWRVDVIDAAGRRVCELARGVGRGEKRSLMWDLRVGRGGRAPAGLYWVRLVTANRAVARRLVVIDPAP